MNPRKGLLTRISCMYPILSRSEALGIASVENGQAWKASLHRSFQEQSELHVNSRMAEK